MASDLLLGYEETIQSVPTEYERLCLRETWWSVVTLDIISSWGQSEFLSDHIERPKTNFVLE